MKGIILAGGTGSRLFPITISVVKQLLPIYDKPLIYYPFSTLLDIGVTEFLIICTEKDKPAYQKLFGNGEKFGVTIQYTIQDKPNGLAEAYILGEHFIGNDSVWMILGDNIFVGEKMIKILREVPNKNRGGTVFAYKVKDPERYGIIEFEGNTVKSIVEKPVNPKSNYAQTGLYYFDSRVVHVAKTQKPSERGEIEITEASNFYLNNNELDVVRLPKDTVWLDTGTQQSLYDASDFIRVIQERQGTLIGSPETIAYKNKLITKEDLLNIAKEYSKSEYGKGLLNLIKENDD